MCFSQTIKIVIFISRKKITIFSGIIFGCLQYSWVTYAIELIVLKTSYSDLLSQY